MKSAAVLTRTGHVTSFFDPAVGNLAAQVFSTPGIGHLRQKKIANAGGWGSSWVHLELTEALHSQLRFSQ